MGYATLNNICIYIHSTIILTSYDLFDILVCKTVRADTIIKAIRCIICAHI